MLELGRPPWLALLALASGIGAWLAATATYRADDFGLVAEAWHAGDIEAAIAQWWQFHTAPRDPGGWPKFYRPVWHAAFFVDAHLFSASAGASAALSWLLHVVNAALVALLVRRFASAGWAWAAALLFLLPGAALQAPTWIAARGQVMALQGTLAAIAVATAATMPMARRAIGVTAATLFAAGSHDFGALAGPMATWAAWRCAPASTPSRWLATILLPMSVAVAWIVWRASRLGCWAGGYSGSGTADASVTTALKLVANGFGSVLLPGDGRLPTGLTTGVGAVALVALAAIGAKPGPAGALAKLAVALAVACLAPTLGNVFRGDDLLNGRYLYAAHAAWALGFVAMLAPLTAGRWRVLALAAAAFMILSAAAGFATSLAGLHRAHEQMRALFAAVETLPTDEPVALLGAPDAIGAQLLLRNALPAALGAPFRSPCRHVVAHATDFELDNGCVLGLACAYERNQEASARRWDADAHSFVACAKSEGPAFVTDARLEQPSNDGSWRYFGRPGDVVVLLAGDESCRFDLGRAGSLGVASSRRFALGVADAAGNLLFSLPASAVGAQRFQTLTLRGLAPAIALSNVVVSGTRAGQ